MAFAARVPQLKKVVRDVVSSAPKKASAGGFWDAVVKTRKPTTKNVSETTVSQMLRVIFPEYRLKIIRTFHGAVKENTTKTIAFLIAAEQLEPVKNIVEGTERLEEIKATLMSGECDHMFELDVCEELHQLVAAMVQVEQDMLNGLAATLNKPRIVEALCVSGADAEFMKKSGQSILFSSAAIGHAEVVRILLKYKADPNNAHKSGCTPLWIACANGHTEVVKSLVDNGAFKNDAIRLRTVLELDTDSTAMKAVIEALESRGKAKKPEGEWGEEDGQALMGLLAASGAKSAPKGKDDNNEKDRGSKSVVTQGGATALWIAACNGHAEICEFLIEKGANAEALCNDTSPLWIAAANGHHSVVAALRWRTKLEHRSIDGATPLWAAAENGHYDVVSSLLDGGANTEACSMDQRTPLHIAAGNRHSAVVKRLLVAGANPRATSADGSTAAHVLMSKGFSTSGSGKGDWEEVMAMLVKAGVNVTATKVNGMNALHDAVSMLEYEQVKYLMEQGQLDPNQCDEEGHTPLHLAAAKGDARMGRLLLNRGNTEMVKLLLEAKADCALVDKTGVSPLMAAIENGSTDCVAALKVATQQQLTQSKGKVDFGGRGHNSVPSFLKRSGF
eukprot:CAMPEP_0177772650 /NCGR_PEP_ID=MMETSP0491_2-20121128/12372_1 /TAXON_ID=63592 /ORGANISM="Tetraselmis chuii, Strain PLY429" /LENGTH=617 /DNA_ID=CAMNT_0019290547 /DNA_START=202 /DNA_END=2055 /DNA_ORIENTATION=-